MACCTNASTDRVVRQADRLLTALVAAFDQCERPFCRASLAHGSVAWDICCDCCTEDGEPASGQLWVKVTSIYPSDQFPSPMTEKVKCSHGWAADLEVGHLRCSKAMDSDGKPPCADDLSAEARNLLLDASVIRSAIECDWAPDLDCSTFMVGGWSPTGPSGGCAGGVQRLTFAFFEPGCG